MIAAGVLWWCLSAAQAAGTPAASAPTAAVTIDRAAILARDPARLPRAAQDAWKGFDIGKFDDAPILQTVVRARDGILRGDFIGALGDLISILEARPDFPPALHMTGVLYFRLQRYGDSATMLGRYIEVAPERIGDTRVLGHDLYTLGRYDEARAHYERVLERAPGDVEAWRGLSLATWRAGDTEAALAHLAHALEMAPANDDLWSWKATIAFDAGDDKAAQEAAEHALALDAFEPRTWFTLARILDETGQESAARSARARFESLAQTAAAVRRAEARLLLAPDSAARVAEWLDVIVAHGAPGSVRTALQRLSQNPRVAKVPEVLRPELDACRLLHDEDRGRAAARDLERSAGDDAKAWRSLLAWSESVGDASGAERARAHLAR